MPLLTHVQGDTRPIWIHSESLPDFDLGSATGELALSRSGVASLTLAGVVFGQAGTQRMHFSPTSAQSLALAPGAYLCRVTLVAGGVVQTVADAAPLVVLAAPLVPALP